MITKAVGHVEGEVSIPWHSRDYTGEFSRIGSTTVRRASEVLDCRANVDCQVECYILQDLSCQNTHLLIMKNEILTCKSG